MDIGEFPVLNERILAFRAGLWQDELAREGHPFSGYLWYDETCDRIASSAGMCCSRQISDPNLGSRDRETPGALTSIPFHGPSP